MNSISNETLERLESYKKVSSDVINKIENNLTYVETLLIYEIMNSNFFNKDKMFFNYKLFSKLTIKKYSKLYERELTTLKKDLIASLNKDLKYAINDNVKQNVINMIEILERPIEDKFEDKSRTMIENFEASMDEIIHSNALLSSNYDGSNASDKLLESMSDGIAIQETERAEVANEQAPIHVETEPALSEEELAFKKQEELVQEELARKQQEELAKKQEEEQAIKHQQEAELAQAELAKQQQEEQAQAEEEKRQQEQLDLKRAALIRAKQEEIKSKEEVIVEENKEIENMLGAIDNIYDEIGEANLDEIDYTSFLKYIDEEDIDSINMENIVKDTDSVNNTVQHPSANVDNNVSETISFKADISNDSINMDDLIKDTDSNIELNENLSKTLDDLDLGNSSNLEDLNIEDLELNSVDDIIDEEVKDTKVKMEEKIQVEKVQNAGSELNNTPQDATTNNIVQNTKDGLNSVKEDVQVVKEEVVNSKEVVQAAKEDVQVASPKEALQNTKNNIQKTEEDKLSDQLEKELLGSLDLGDMDNQLNEEIALEDSDLEEEMSSLLGELDDIKPVEKKSKFSKIKFGFKKNK